MRYCEWEKGSAAEAGFHIQRLEEEQNMGAFIVMLKEDIALEGLRGKTMKSLLCLKMLKV